MECAGADASSRTPFAAFGAFLFLLHPLQTESVAYISGRSESLCGMFAPRAWRRSFTAARRLFRGAAWQRWWPCSEPLCSPRSRQWCLPALFLLTDLWWNPDFPLRSVRANWKLYVVLAAGAAAGVALFWRLISAWAPAAAPASR